MRFTHYSSEMLSRYNHLCNEANCKTLYERYARQTVTEIATRKKRDAHQAQAQQGDASSASVAPKPPSDRVTRTRPVRRH